MDASALSAPTRQQPSCSLKDSAPREQEEEERRLDRAAFVQFKIKIHNASCAPQYRIGLAPQSAARKRALADGHDDPLLSGSESESESESKSESDNGSDVPGQGGRGLQIRALRCQGARIEPALVRSQ